jgi:hypothetical protein
METQTRYDLNTAIENWRAELAAQANLTAEVRRELETHLRDAITGFQQRGLNDEESFWLACKRVGQPLQIAGEFLAPDLAKAWCQRLGWMFIGVLGINILRFIMISPASVFVVSFFCIAALFVWPILPAKVRTKLGSI